MARLTIYDSPEEAGIEPRKISAVLIRGPHLSIVVTVEEDDPDDQPTDTIETDRLSSKEES